MKQEPLTNRRDGLLSLIERRKLRLQTILVETHDDESRVGRPKLNAQNLTRPSLFARGLRQKSELCRLRPESSESAPMTEMDALRVAARLSRFKVKSCCLVSAQLARIRRLRRGEMWTRTSAVHPHEQQQQQRPGILTTKGLHL